ncbi:hypothetical protein EQ718_21620 (plasmid) [Paracoccus versutus]|uniref:Uncharacterized protein n=1 Tax=Paracoccus versutus TaxID=34007 RepID=A0AAQ0KLB3_PARVE|nr:hypothetical protein [Paracoccus versutus]REG46062.1 hypothetical protein ATH84_101782 [Paracoccus versutus]WEJ81441.1 hypothetical protein EQ718_21620 [Paracoccus versutus]
MDTAYSINRHWSDRFIPEIRRIVGAHLLRVAPEYLDTRHATDLLMLDGRDMRIAARVRRHGYAGRYPYGFTIRSRLPSGNPTELAKIVNGEGDWLFYGHADAGETGFDLWWLLDLRAFRAGLIRHASNGYPISSGDRMNMDGTCFKWFDIRSFPREPPLVLATSGPRSTGPSPWQA